MRYVFRDGPVTIRNAAEADPQVIGEAIAKIAGACGGKPKPRDVVAAARSNRHPLHKHFEWDDKEAADAFRLSQARELMRVIRIESDKKGVPSSPAWISVHDVDGNAYRSIDEVRSSRELQLIVLRQAERDLLAIERRYQDLIEVCDLVRTARGIAERKRAKIEKEKTTPREVA